VNNNIEKTKKRHILIVDDSKLQQLVIQKHLERRGNLEVSIANNGKIAIDKLIDEDFDLIVMDIRMPVMNGLDATKYIRTEMNYSSKNLPILGITAYEDFFKDDRYLNYGMQDCFLLPLNYQGLLEKIDFYLAKKKE